jgi:hypothetical protein
METPTKATVHPLRQVALWLSLALLLETAHAATLVAEEVPQKRSAPDAAALKDAETNLRQTFKNDFSRKAASDRQVLAKKLIGLAAEEADSDHPVKQFAMLSLARELAVDVGELPTAFEAVAALDHDFAIDPIKLKVDSITRVVKNPRLRDLHWSTAVQTMAVAEEAVAQFDYEAATKLTGIAINVGKRTKHDMLQDVASTRQKELVASRPRFDRARKASARLLEDASDAAAKTVLGEYFCGVAATWEKGLSFLEECDNGALRDLAGRDVGNPSDAASQVALGNGWLQAADGFQQPLKTHFQRRARSWFLKAWPALKGLAQTDVEKKIKLIPARPAVLAIHAEIDGVDEIVVTEARAELIHREWELPALIEINGDVHWAPGTTRILPNAGETRFLPDGVNFAKASVVKLQGRGEVRVVPALDRVTIELRDGEVGGDTYEVLVFFAE